eukprot:PhM_4_TR16254/c0_g1_i1/m.48827
MGKQLVLNCRAQCEQRVRGVPTSSDGSKMPRGRRHAVSSGAYVRIGFADSTSHITLLAWRRASSAVAETETKASRRTSRLRTMLSMNSRMSRDRWMYVVSDGRRHTPRSWRRASKSMYCPVTISPVHTSTTLTASAMQWCCIKSARMRGSHTTFCTDSLAKRSRRRPWISGTDSMSWPFMSTQPEAVWSYARLSMKGTRSLVVVFGFQYAFIATTDLLRQLLRKAMAVGWSVTLLGTGGIRAACTMPRITLTRSASSFGEFGRVAGRGTSSSDGSCASGCGVVPPISLSPLLLLFGRSSSSSCSSARSCVEESPRFTTITSSSSSWL